MKKIKNINVVLILILFFISSSNFFANYKGDEKGNNKKPNLQKSLVDPSQSLININNVTMWVTQEGFHDWVVASGWNGAFPNGTNVGAIFAEGIVWGGQVDDGNPQVVRVGGNTYGTGTAPVTRLFRVRPDYLTGNLTSDAATFFSKPLGQVTDGDIQTIRDQYAKDWNEWPASEGAPFNDVNNDNMYDPTIDIPGVPGASQTLFIKYNDRLSESLYGSIPIGLEVSETYWAYAYSGALGNVIYKKVDIVYKGTPTSKPDSKIDSMYIVQWADPDVGTSSDDYAGSDTTLNLGYAYSSKDPDNAYSGLGLAPPAVGYDFLQGVSVYTGNESDSAIFNLQWRKGYKYVNPKPMSSFIYFAAGGTWEDPDLVSYVGSLQFYNLMRGYLPRPPYPSADPFPENVTDYTPYGAYHLTGDPVAGTGKLDGAVDPAGDRRINVINGPITMNLGDTAEVVLALVYGLGQDHLSSVTALKTNDITAQIVFDQLFQLPSVDPPQVNIAELDQEIVLNWGEDFGSIEKIESYSDQGYTFEGYEVYQLPTASSSLSDGTLLGVFDLVNGITAIYDTIIDANGMQIPELSVSGTDKGLQRYLTITNDEINGNRLINGQEYYFAVVAYAYNPSPLLPFHAVRSPFVVYTVVPQKPTPGNRVPDAAQDINVTHEGLADASVDIKIIDPTKLTGDQYDITFHNEVYSLGPDGEWTDITQLLKQLKKPEDLTGSSITSTASYGEKAGTVNIHYLVDVVSVNYDWCDGVILKLPSNIIIDEIVSPVSHNDGEIIPYTFDQASNTIFFGDSSRSTNGKFAGGEDIMLTVRGVTLPLITDYIMFDDGWGDANGYPGGIIDVYSTDTLTVINEMIVTQKQWDVTNVTTGEVVVKNQTILNGVDLYAPNDFFAEHGVFGPGGSSGSPYSTVGTPANPIFDGIQVSINGSYDAPTTIASSMASVEVNGTELRFDGARWSNTNFNVTDFTYFGYPDGTSLSSLLAYNGGVPAGVPLTDINSLQADYELRWTGVLGKTTINGVTIEITESGGQMATLFGASNYDIADHPLNPNPGSSDPFLVRVPFEVWNLDKNEQVNIVLWDREGNPTVSGGKVWNTNNRVYVWCVNTTYDPNNPIDPASQTVIDNATWNWVIYKSTFTKGDVLKLTYPNPIQMGVDKFTFTSPEVPQYSSELAKDDIAKINVFPNPYYGYQYRETAPNNKYVTFSHLPERAIIRIFDLSGVLVRTIEHTADNGQFEYWNLQNDNNLPVASGVYIVYIDMPTLGKNKILKLAVIQEQQMLKVY